MNVITKVLSWLNPSTLEDKWATRSLKLAKVRLEFEGGLVRELKGEAADNWNRDIFFGISGRSIDWSTHKWKETRKE